MNGLEIKYKIIVLILLLILTVYLMKTDKPREEKEEIDVKPSEETPRKIFTIEDPEYWIEKLEEKDLVLMDGKKIQEFNRRNFSRVESLVDLKEHDPIIKKEDLIHLINSISTIPNEERYDKDGNVMDRDYYNLLLSNLNLDSIKDTNIQYGTTINRTFLRTFPTYEPSYRKKGDTQFDRFQETAVYSLEPIIIYSESSDREWYFARMYNYIGWIPKDKIAIGEKEEIFNYIDMEPFIVAIDRQIIIGDILFDMGVRIPLKEEKENSYIILIPEKDENNKFQIKEYEINKFKELNLGYLPYTKENIILQAFKLNGEQYGWGGLNNTRDCSAFMMDIYRTFGIKLPRNTLEQGSKSLGRQYDLNHNMPLERKMEILEELPKVTPLYMPGHTMLYLGKDKDEYYIIHQFAEHYVGNEGTLEKISMMKTAVTPVTIKISSGKTYLENIYLAKEFIIE